MSVEGFAIHHPEKGITIGNRGKSPFYPAKTDVAAIEWVENLANASPPQTGWTIFPLGLVRYVTNKVAVYSPEAAKPVYPDPECLL